MDAAAAGGLYAKLGASDEAGARTALTGLIGLSGVTEDADKLDNVRLVIDSNDAGDLEILVVTQSGFNSDGSVNPQGVAVPVDLGVSVGSVSLESKEGDANTATATLASNINLDILLGPQKFVIANEGTSGLIKAQGYFKIAETSSLDLDVVGVSITELKVGNFLGDNALTGQAGAVDFTNSWADSDLNNYTQVGYTYYEVEIGANASDQLVVDVNNFNTDIQMNVAIGGASIGQISITDLDVAGTSLTVYGH